MWAQDNNAGELIAHFPPQQEQHQKERRPRFSPQEFTKKQEAFIIHEAGLTPAEAGGFFPLFQQMQRQLFELNRKTRRLMRQVRTEKLTEKQYADILKELGEIQIQKVRVENHFHNEFTKVLSVEKVLRSIDASNRFDRVIIKQMIHEKK